MINYITHLNTTFNRFCNDRKLSPFHVSLYFALFHFWNAAKFRTPISINREETMVAAKIGSANTYTRCLRELHDWGYIRYEPSFSPLVGSKIHLYTFNKSDNKTTNNASDISSDKGSWQAPEKVLRPSIKTKTNKSNNKKHEHIRPKNSGKISSTNQPKTRARKKVAPKKEVSLSFGEGRKGEAPRCARPLLPQVKKYFAEKSWASIEAEKFFNYYQSNGWLVGGKTPMKSWKAAAKNWMLNSVNFTNGKGKRAGNLNVSTDKNYSEPL